MLGVLHGHEQSQTGARSKWANFVLVACLVFAALCSNRVYAQDLEVVTVRPFWKEGIYYIDATVFYKLSAEAYDALESGVTLTFVADIRVTRARKYWLSEDVAALQQQYTLRYHALSDQYILSNVNSGAEKNFPTLKGALLEMGNIVALPLFDNKLLQSSEDHTGSIRVRLDVDALPTPLRLLAYITSGWHLASDWKTWNVTTSKD